MKRLLLNLWLGLALIPFPAALWAQDVSPEPLSAQIQDNGIVVIYENQKFVGYLMPQLFLKDWKIVFFSAPGKQDDCDAVAKLPDGSKINFKISLKAGPKGLSVHCLYVPQKDVMYVQNREAVFFPYGDWLGDNYSLENQKGAFPKDVTPSDGGVIGHTDGQIEIGPSHKNGLTVAFKGQKLFRYLQDVRQWSPDLSVYYTEPKSPAGETAWKAGEEKVYDFTLSFNRKISVKPLAAPEDLDALRPQIDAIVKPVIEGGWCPGISVGIQLNGKTQVLGYGQTSLKGGNTPDGDTEYEIGSITKLFTKLLFSDMVHREAMGLEDKAQTYLPANVKLPTKNGKEITLLTLSNHTSGLSHDPETWTINKSGTYSEYSLNQLYDYLSHTQLLSDPGEKFSYSNTGVALLGDLVAQKNGTSWEGFLKKRILDPVGMGNTGVRWNASEKEKAAQGYDADKNPLELWDWKQSPIMPAGALHSTVNDLMKLAQAAMDKENSPIADIAFDDTAEKLDWGRQVNHDGGTYGFNTSFHVDRDKKNIVIVLGDTGGSAVSRVAWQIRCLVEGKLTAPITFPEITEQSATDLKTYVGKYHVTKKPDSWDPVHDNNMEITLKDGQLLGHSDGGWITDFKLYPLADGNFYSKRGQVEVQFTKDDKGVVTGFTLKDVPSFVAEKGEYKKPEAKSDDNIPPPP